MRAIDILKQTLSLQDVAHGVATIMPNESVSQFMDRYFGKTTYEYNNATFDKPIDFYFIFGKPIEGVCDIECEDEAGDKLYLYMVDTEF